MIDTQSIWTSAWRGIWSGLWVSDQSRVCNITTYYNTTTMETINVPFVPCGQAYVLGEQIIVLGQPMIVLGEQ